MTDNRVITLVHVGIRPKHTIRIPDDIKMAESGYRHEMMPKGGYRVWSKRMLKSGCGCETFGSTMLGELIYCEKCQEYFSREQFKEK